MSTFEEIVEKVSKLNAAQQLRLLEIIDDLEQPQTMQEEVLARATAQRRKLREKYGKHFVPSVQELIDETREERLNDIMGRD